MQPPLDALAHDIPGLTGAGIAGKLGEATVELARLCCGEGQLAGLGGDAVPEVLGELDALGDGELTDIEVGGAHAYSLPRAPGARNTLPVDVGLPPSVRLTSAASAVDAEGGHLLDAVVIR